MGQPGMQQPGMQQPGAANPYASAQGAIAGAGSMMTIMKWAFLGVGGLCVLMGVIGIFLWGLIAGLSTAFTGAIFVAVALFVLPQFTGMVGQAGAMVDGLAAKANLKQTGMPATGTIMHVQQTGRLINYQPEVAFTVQVNHPQMGQYQVQTSDVVPQIAIPRAQPGAQIQVRIDPTNPQNIALIF